MDQKCLSSIRNSLLAFHHSMLVQKIIFIIKVNIEHNFVTRG